jgi:hypothetical protein
MKELEVVPDFGYEADNFCIQREGGNGWQVLLGLLGNKDRYQWLMNYIKVSKLRNKKKALDDK